MSSSFFLHVYLSSKSRMTKEANHDYFKGCPSNKFACRNLQNRTATSPLHFLSFDSWSRSLPVHLYICVHPSWIFNNLFPGGGDHSLLLNISCINTSWHFLNIKMKILGKIWILNFYPNPLRGGYEKITLH